MYDGCCNRGLGRLGTIRATGSQGDYNLDGDAPLEDITGGGIAATVGQGYSSINVGGTDIQIPEWVPNILSQVFGAFGAKPTPPPSPQVQPVQHAGFDTGGLLLPAVVIAAAGLAAVAVWKSLK